MQPWAKKFYHSQAWLDCRAAYIAGRIRIDGGLCEECGIHHGKIVHHTVWLTPKNVGDPSITLNPALLRYVCKKCHDNEHLRTKQSRCRFDSDGNLLPPVAPGRFTAPDRSPNQKKG